MNLQSFTTLQQTEFKYQISDLRLEGENISKHLLKFLLSDFIVLPNLRFKQ